jgi:hypothetical protein
MNIPASLMVFFGENGLSQTEANHQANMVKEVATIIGRQFQNTAAVTESITINDGNTVKTVKLDNKTAIADIEIEAELEGELYALSAWLREAIKAKQSVLQLVEHAEDKAFLLPGEVLPELTMQRPYFKEPAKQKTWTAEDILGEFSVAERADYLKKESIAAHLGKKIHAGGILAQIKEELSSFAPFRFQDLNNNGGKHSFPVERTALYEVKAFNKAFLELQERHRVVEAKLNWYKARIQNTVTERNAEEYAEHRKRYDEAYTLFQKELNVFNDHAEDVSNRIAALSQTLNQRRLLKIREVSAWKIVIPQKLEETAKFVQNYGK